MPTLFDFAKPRQSIKAMPGTVHAETPVVPVDRKRIVLCRLESKVLSAMVEAIGLVTDEAEFLFTREGLRVDCSTEDAKLACQVIMSRVGLRDSDVTGNGMCVPVNIHALLVILRKFKFPENEFVTMILNAEAERIVLQAKGYFVPVIKVSIPTAGKIRAMPCIPTQVIDCSFVITMKRVKQAIDTLKSVGTHASTFLDQEMLVMAVNEDDGECTVRIKAGRGKTGLMQLRGSLPASMAFDLDLVAVAQVLKIVSPLHEAINIQLATSHAAIFTTWFNHNTGKIIFTIPPWIKPEVDDDEHEVDATNGGSNEMPLECSDLGYRACDYDLKGKALESLELSHGEQ